MSALLPPLLLALAPCSSHFEFGVGEVALKICALTWRINFGIFCLLLPPPFRKGFQRRPTVGVPAPVMSWITFQSGKNNCDFPRSNARRGAEHSEPVNTVCAQHANVAKGCTHTFSPFYRLRRLPADHACALFPIACKLSRRIIVIKLAITIPTIL